MEITGWITLAAVIVALGIGVASILHTQSLQKKERRERLLNEIIEWAIDVSNCSISISGSEAIKAEEDPHGKVEQILTHAQLTEWGIRLQSMMTRGKYISASAKIFCDDVKTAIKKLNEDLDQFIKSLHSCADIKYKGLSSTVYRKQLDKSLELRDIMDNSALKVIEEATKIKTRDIS